MNFPNVTIQCEAATKKWALGRIKQCKKDATFCIIIKHVGPNCDSIDHMFCTEHKQIAEQEVTKQIVLAQMAAQLSGFLRCMVCHTDITESEEIGTITEL